LAGAALLKWRNTFSAKGVKKDLNKFTEEIIQMCYISADSLNLATDTQKSKNQFSADNK